RLERSASEGHTHWAGDDQMAGVEDRSAIVDVVTDTERWVRCAGIAVIINADLPAGALSGGTDLDGHFGGGRPEHPAVLQGCVQPILIDAAVARKAIAGIVITF